MNAPLPNIDLALTLAEKATGKNPLKARRFATGLRHYVYDVEFVDRKPIVVRIASYDNRDTIASAVRLSKLLRPRGLPLPAILSEDTKADFPYMILERLPGRDFGEVMNQLSEEALDKIAEKIVAAQKIVASLPSVGRYGYAVSAEEARHETWSQVLDKSLAGSRARISAAGLFSIEPVNAIARLVDANRRTIDELGATPFLHDTTTKNVIIAEDGAFSGIVDVDSLCWGDPSYPAALTMASILFHGGPVSYVHAWMRHAGLPVDEIFRIYVALFLVTFMSEYGQTFNDKELILAGDEKERLLNAFSKTTERV